jgi:hypothetical protein
MTCHTQPRSSGGTVDSTTDFANAVRRLDAGAAVVPLGEAERTHRLFPRGRLVAVREAVTSRMFSGEVLLDLPGRRVLVQLLGSSIVRWARQEREARLVTVEGR